MKFTPFKRNQIKPEYAIQIVINDLHEQLSKANAAATDARNELANQIHKHKLEIEVIEHNLRIKEGMDEIKAEQLRLEQA